MDVRMWCRDKALANWDHVWSLLWDQGGDKDYRVVPLSVWREIMEVSLPATAEALAPVITKLVTELEDEARLLDSWIHQSITGGWSTHQVDPMRLRAAQIRGALAELEKP